ncbi:MAG: hypothetical protein RL685_1080 [Pseudomonadota bacterium]|jgi:hypothetical protein
MAEAGARKGAWVMRGIAAGVLGCLLQACSAAQQAPPPAPLPATGRALDSGLQSGLRIVEAEGQGLEFPLPDAAGWRLDKREQHSWVARHLRSSSQLVVRAWRAEDIARPEDCERQARLWRKELPRLTPGEQIEQSERLLGGLYRGRVTIGVRSAQREPGRLLGHVLAFGSDARSCLLIAFATTAAGAAAHSVIAERLAIVEGTVFQRLRRLDIEGRITTPHR